MIVFQYIASAVLGPDSFKGGLPTALLGLLFHLTIATSWTALFFFAYPRVALLRKNWVGSGIGYGIFVWVMMNRVIVPMTKIPSRPFVLQNAVIAILILMVAIGTPISFLARRFYTRRDSSA